MVPDDTVHKVNNHPPFGTQVGLTFYFSIYPYTLPFQLIRGMVHAGAANPTTHCQSTTKTPSSSGTPQLFNIRATFLKAMEPDRP